MNIICRRAMNRSNCSMILSLTACLTKWIDRVLVPAHKIMQTKDLGLALTAAEEAGSTVPLTEKVHEM